MSFQDAIHQHLFRIGATQGVGAGTLRAVLDGLPPAAGPLNHLLQAFSAVRPLFRGDGELVSAAMDYALETLWFGELERCIRRHPMLQDEAAPPPLSPPPGGLDPEFYPEEAHDAFDQGLLLKSESASADLILLWKRSDRIAIMHAHPEGFWEVAPDPVAWIGLLADAMETGNNRGLVRFRVQRFCEATTAERYSLLIVDPVHDSAIAAGRLPPPDQVEVVDELRRVQLTPDAVLSRKVGGRSVWLDVSVTERARWQQGEPAHPIHGTAAAEVKRQLNEIVRGSVAKTFSLNIDAQTRTGLAPRRLLRQAAAISAARKKGQGALVTPEVPARDGSPPERLRL